MVRGINGKRKRRELREGAKLCFSVLEGGQSYKIGTRMLTRANLTELVRLQKSLMGLVAQDDNNNLFSDTYRAVFDGR